MNPNNSIGPLDPVDDRKAAAASPVLVGDLYAGRSTVNPGQPRTYSDKTYVVQPGQLNREDWLRWSNWMPSMDQLLAAVRLNVADAVDPWEHRTVTATMRQGIGMIVLLALIAGIIPFLANLWLRLTMQTSVPLAQAANSVTPLTTAYPPTSAITIIGTAVQTIAGLPPRMPGVLAGFLSALGMWINTPLYWLGVWIVYGLFVFGLARLMGARNTLQAFLCRDSVYRSAAAADRAVADPRAWPTSGAGGPDTGVCSLFQGRAIRHKARRWAHVPLHAAAARGGRSAAADRLAGGAGRQLVPAGPADVELRTIFVYTTPTTRVVLAGTSNFNTL